MLFGKEKMLSTNDTFLLLEVSFWKLFSLVAPELAVSNFFCIPSRAVYMRIGSILVFKPTYMVRLTIRFSDASMEAFIWRASIEAGRQEDRDSTLARRYRTVKDVMSFLSGLPSRWFSSVSVTPFNESHGSIRQVRSVKWDRFQGRIETLNATIKMLNAIIKILCTTRSSITITTSTRERDQITGNRDQKPVNSSVGLCPRFCGYMSSFL